MSIGGEGSAMARCSKASSRNKVHFVNASWQEKEAISGAAGLGPVTRSASQMSGSAAVRKMGVSLRDEIDVISPSDAGAEPADVSILPANV